MVIDSITSSGKLDASVDQRIFWALIEGFLAIALLLGGGLAAMQTTSVSSGILFLLILFVICYSLIVDLKKDLSTVKKES